MLEEAFKEAVYSSPKGQSLAPACWNEILAHYSNAARHYHSLDHLEALYAFLYEVKSEINDWTTLVFSIAYHDIIYNPLKGNNEEKSAAFAVDRLGKLGLPVEQIERCEQQILATKGHAANGSDDTNYFTDADLAILGTPPDFYAKYATDIRKEYHIFPDLIYKPGRKKVLIHFLSMPRIFKTEYFFSKFEEQARININAELTKYS